MDESVHFQQQREINELESQREVFLDGEGKSRLDSVHYYAEYHGHPVHQLQTLVNSLRPRPIVWLAGDSSLDNKHWFYPGFKTKIEALKEYADDMDGPMSSFMAPACNGLEERLLPAISSRTWLTG